MNAFDCNPEGELVEPGYGRVWVKFENDYSDGHHSERVLGLPAPPDERTMLDAWVDAVVYPETGDGHGSDPELGSCLTATVVSGHWTGMTWEWID